MTEVKNSQLISNCIDTYKLFALSISAYFEQLKSSQRKPISLCSENIQIKKCVRFLYFFSWNLNKNFIKSFFRLIWSDGRNTQSRQTTSSSTFSIFGHFGTLCFFETPHLKFIELIIKSGKMSFSGSQSEPKCVYSNH